MRRAHAFVLVMYGGTVSAQEPYTIDRAVADAVANHPELASARFDADAASARVDEARAGYLPSVGVGVQVNRSTGNTAPGAFFPQTGFLPVAGPVRGKSIDEGAWQTGVSLWASYDVLNFARQSAIVGVASAAHVEATAETEVRKLDIAYRAADAFVRLLEAQETVRAAKANVDRAQSVATVVKPLVDQNLRPGADAARAEAELANAQTLLARTEQTREVRRAQLADAVGNAKLHADAAPGSLLAGADAQMPSARVESHPLVVLTSATVDRAASAERAVTVQYFPKVDLVASLWARGSGYYGSPGDGLVPDIANWAVGVVVSWSVFDIPAVRARSRAADASHSAALARRDAATLAVSSDVAGANAALEGAQRVARLTPKALDAARAAEQQATARFKTGLSSVVDVADAQRLLAQTEVDDVVARLEVRRAQLLLARASGDLGPFLAQVR
jgi:outer membrane protein TolC